MQVSLRTSPKTAIQKHPNYRVVSVSTRQGSVGMLLPHANLVVPDKQAVHDLKEILKLYEKLEPQPETTRVGGHSLTHAKLERSLSYWKAKGKSHSSTR